MCAYPAALANFKIGFKPSASFNYTLGWTIEPTGAAFNAFFPQDHRPLCAPVSGFQLGILGRDRAQVIGNFGTIKRLFGLFLHLDPFPLH